MSKKLLLADDSITIRKVVGIIFTNEDCSLSVVEDGIAALEKAREIKPDVILADVLMPGKTGYEVCEEIRRDPELKDIPLLLLTGAFEPFDEDKARECGADDFISKPFESQQLLEKVNRLIELGNERITARTILEAEIEVPQPPPPSPTAEVFTGETMVAFAQPEEGFGDEAFLIEELSASEGIIEALPEDDPWGAFELEEPVKKTPGELEPGLDREFAELENMDLRSLGVEAPEPPLETAFAPPEYVAPSSPPAAEETFTLGEETEEAEFGMQMEPEEEFFAFTPEEEAEGEEGSDGEIFLLGAESEEEEFGTVSATPSLEMAPSEPEPELQFAPEEEYIPVIPPAAASPEPSFPAASVVEQAAASGEATLSEEQLASLIGKVSRDIIEKIVWEVVPDLAEMLIREEIRKIKKGIQD